MNSLVEQNLGAFILIESAFFSVTDGGGGDGHDVIWLDVDDDF